MGNSRRFSRQDIGRSKSSSSSQNQRSSSRVEVDKQKYDRRNSNDRHNDDTNKDNWRDREKQPYRKNFQFPPKSTQDLRSKIDNHLQNKQNTASSDSCMNHNDRKDENRSEYNDLKKQVNDLKRQLELEKSSSKGTIADLKEKIKEKNEKIKEKNEKIEIKNTIIENLEISNIKDVDDLKRQLELEKFFNQDTITNLKEKIKLKDKMIQKFTDEEESTISTLRNELQTITETLHKTQISIDNTNKEIHTVKEQGKKDQLICQETIVSLNKTIQDLTEEATNKECIHQDSIASLNEQIKNITEQRAAQNDINQDTINNLISNKESLLKDLDELKIKHEESARQNNREKLALKSEIEKIKLEKTDLHKRASTSIDHWRKKLSDSENNSIKNMTDLETSITNLTNAKESLKINLAALKEANLNLVHSQKEANISIQNGKENITQLEMELSRLKESHESVSKELYNVKNLLASKEQLSIKLINEKKENKTTIIEKQNIIEKMKEKINIAETNEKKSLDQLSEFQSKISSLNCKYQKEKEETEYKHVDVIKDLEEEMKSIREENENLKKDVVEISRREDGLHIDINYKGEIQKFTSSLESSNQLISEQTAQIDLLKQEIKLNNFCLKNIETFRSNLEIARKELSTEKAKTLRFEMQNTDDNKTIEQCKNELNIYKEKVIILEKKIENIQRIGKLQSTQTIEGGQMNSLEVVRIKEMLAEENVEVQNTSEDNNGLNSKLEEMEGQIKALETKFKETKNFDDDTIKNLKEKIKIKDETIKRLTDKVEKYWPQRVENLNHLISVKREKIASKSGSGAEELVEPSSTSVPSSCASNSPNLNKFFELNEKLAENEDFIKSLKTILNDKEEEIAKLKQLNEIEGGKVIEGTPKSVKPAEKRPLDKNSTKEHIQKNKKKRIN